MIKMIRKVLRDNKGVAAMEYAILAGIVVLGVVAGMNTAGLETSLNNKFAALATAVDNAK